MSGGASGQPPDNGAKSTCFRRGKAGVCVGEEANQTAAGSGSVEEDYPGGGGSDAMYQGFFGKGLDPLFPTLSLRDGVGDVRWGNRFFNDS